MSFFKEKKTNTQRKEQLELLESIRHIESDEMKLGALIQLSQDIDKEWNLFDSEMKKQVDAVRHPSTKFKQQQ